MTTKRIRTGRHSQLSQEALDWLQTGDAHQFFIKPAFDPNGYGSIDGLPGVRPWWNPLREVWQQHVAGLPLEGDPRTQQPALDFLLALHAEFLSQQSKRRTP